MTTWKAAGLVEGQDVLLSSCGRAHIVKSLGSDAVTKKLSTHYELWREGEFVATHRTLRDAKLDGADMLRELDAEK